MADLYGLEASGLPPELVAQLAGTQGRRKIAESMLQRGMTPLQVPSGNISWTQGLAQLLNAYVGRKGLDQADQEAQGIADKRKAMVSEALANYEKQRMGQPMQTAPFEADTFPGEAPIQGLQTITKQAVAPDKEAAYRGAMMSAFPELQKVATTDYNIDAKKETREDQQAFQKEQLKAQKEAQIEQLKLRLEDRRLSAEERAATQAMMIRLAASLRPEPAPALATIADPNDPNKAIVVDARTAKKIGDSPKMTDVGKAGAKDAKRLEGFGAAIQEAKDLLSGVRRGPDGEVLPGAADMPTQSGLGALADSAASLVGVTLKGSKEADRLGVIAGKLISMVPRFEGPQSDKDVALYKQMAGDAANPKLPADRRLAAVVQMEKLYAKQPSAFEPKGSAPTPTAPRVVDW